MPWCDTCDKYLAPNSVEEDGTCPTCHDPVDAGDVGNKPGQRAPWHFWLMVALLVAYLGYRLVQGVLWGLGKI